jgi:maleylacetate reductase
MDEFHYHSYAQEVIFGAGSLKQLGEAVEHLGQRRFMLCANHSMQAGGHVDSVTAILGERLVTVFDGVQPHVQDVQVDEILAIAAEKNADAFIGMGGGSPIGMAKAVAAALGQKTADQPVFPVIAIPSTYAGSEMTPVYGITHTHENPPRKVTVNDPKSIPKLVIYDPNLTIDLPPEMTASTGINALAHCIEALYSIKRNPVSTAVATSGVRHITNALLRCFQDGNDVDARTEMLLGSHLAGLSLASVTMGLHHGLCHILGGSAGVPHGIANSIILPYAIRFNADAVAPRLLPAAEAMGIPVNRINPMVAVEAMVQKIFHLIGQMNLPQRLRDSGAGLQESDLARLAQLGYQNRTVQNNPKPVTAVSQIEKLLREAW